MIEMNPYYSHPSSIGPVFDVATWSPGKVLFMALIALPLGLALLAGAVYFWSPELPFFRPPEFMKDLNREILKLHKEYVWARPAGAGVLGLLGYFFFAAGVSSIVDCLKGDYYFRVGPGGISLRLPNGIDLARFGLVSSVLQLDLAWEDIAEWTIVQVKQLGSLSRNAGNIGGHLKVRTTDGKKREILLDCFREPAHIIHSRVRDALEMVPASFGGPPTEEELHPAGDSIHKY